MTMNLHEAEEMEFARGPRLWDATPGVCCAAFQLGACSHTEGFDPGEEFGDLEPVMRATVNAVSAIQFVLSDEPLVLQQLNGTD